jgi:potassium-transporting ATPase KdpC subunit
MRRQLLPALLMLLIFTVITGLIYPFAVTGIAQSMWHDKANGSLITKDGHVVGSKWIGQSFDAPQYFHPRPAADNYVAGAQGGGTSSYGSNYGPTNPALIGNVPGVNIAGPNPYATPDDPYCVPVSVPKTPSEPFDCDPNTVPERVIAYRTENGLAADATVPVDAVTASASGLDPEISAWTFRPCCGSSTCTRRAAISASSVRQASTSWSSTWRWIGPEASMYGVIVLRRDARKTWQTAV